MEPIVIYSSRKKPLTLFFISLLFATISYLLGSNKWIINIETIVMSLLLYAGVPIFGLTSTMAIFRTIKRRPVLVVSNEGISDSSSLFGLGLITWAEIDRIFYQKKGSDEFWGIALKKPEEFAKRQPFWKKLKRKSGMRTDAAAISIPQKQLPLSIEGFVKQIRATHPEVRLHYPFAIIENNSK